MSNEEIRKNASLLTEKYQTDIDDDFGEECVQFKSFVEGLFDDNDKEPHIEDTDKTSMPLRNIPMKYLKLIREKN